jgi:uncharacterized protein
VTIESTVKLGTESVNWSPCPIRAEWVLEGNPVARIELLSSSADGTANTYFWDCTAGRFNWHYAFDETLYILQGSVTLKSPSGSSRLVTAGDIVFFPAGSCAEWTVEQYIRKLAFCRTPLPSYLVFAKRVRRRLKRLVRGGATKDEAPGLL